MILHITKRTEWEQAGSLGEYRTASLLDQGFIHCSKPDQVIPVANNIFKGQIGLVLLCIDERRLAAAVRYENLQGGQELFPHVYGAINLDAVVKVVDFAPAPDGNFRFSAPRLAP